MRRNEKNSEEIVNGSKLKIAIIVSQFNSDITKKMLSGALNVLNNNKVKKTSIKIVEVPGSFEIPFACQKLAKTRKYNALIALGCVIKGETDHHLYVAGEAIRGIMDIILKYSIPIGFGIITTNTLKQAKERSRGNNNKGREATRAALKMIKIDR